MLGRIGVEERVEQPEFVVLHRRPPVAAPHTDGGCWGAVHPSTPRGPTLFINYGRLENPEILGMAGVLLEYIVFF